MSYEITITQTREIKKVAGKEWEKLGQIEKERFGGGTYLTDQYGYSPEIEKTDREA